MNFLSGDITKAQFEDSTDTWAKSVTTGYKGHVTDE